MDEEPPYTHAEALAFRKQRDEARSELGEVSKKLGIAEAEWENQRKQFYDAITALSTENERLKVAAANVADKVSTQGETAEARLDVVVGKIDQAVIHGMHLGADFGLAAMSSRTGEDYSVYPPGFAGGEPHELEDLDNRLEVYEDHAAAVAATINPQFTLSKLFHE